MEPSNRIIEHGPLTPPTPTNIFSPVKLGTVNLDIHTLMKMQLCKDRLRLRAWRKMQREKGEIVRYKKRNGVIIERGKYKCIM